MATKTARKSKAPKLTLHGPTGQWCKTFNLADGRRRTIYFGSDSAAAMAKYLQEREDWQAGHDPRQAAATALPTAHGATLKYTVNAFLARCKKRVETGLPKSLPARTFADYLDVGRLLTDHFGWTRDPATLRPVDFNGFHDAMTARYAPVRLSKIVIATRTLLGIRHSLLEEVTHVWLRDAENLCEFFLREFLLVDLPYRLNLSGQGGLFHEPSYEVAVRQCLCVCKNRRSYRVVNDISQLGTGHSVTQGSANINDCVVAELPE